MDSSGNIAHIGSRSDTNSLLKETIREMVFENMKEFMTKSDSSYTQDTVDQLNQRIRQLEDDNKRLTAVVLSLTQIG